MPTSKVRMAFQTFVENLPFYGFAVMCADHPEVQAMIARIRDRRIVSYGFSPQADVRAVNVSFSQGASHFDAVFRDLAGKYKLTFIPFLLQDIITKDLRYLQNDGIHPTAAGAEIIAGTVLRAAKSLLTK